MMTRILALAIVGPLAVLAQTPCEGLKSVKLVNAVVTSTEAVSEGPYVAPRPQNLYLIYDASARVAPVLPAHCRVAVTMTPTSDSDIKAEVWMPRDAAWNGKFLAVGGGGLVGNISYIDMARMLREGYATASTDTGHQGQAPGFALGHPEKIVDFAYRAVHEMTVEAKAIIRAHYGREPRLSYFSGCSTGGRQGLMSAQRYPEDYDGIIASASANNQIALSAWRLAVQISVMKDPQRAIPKAKLEMLNRAVLAACDGLDGVKDGFIYDPRKCRFDPSVLLCHGTDANDCLTAPQVESVRMAYSPLRKKNGDIIYPGLVPGGEYGWGLLRPDSQPEMDGLNLGMFKIIVHQNSNWTWRDFDAEKDTALALERVGFIEATNPDLSEFKARGGKLLMFHGWNDGGEGGAISPLNTIDYYSNVLAKMGAEQGEWLRLFMIPGMGHCSGNPGPGPSQFNEVAVLERWRERGIAPERIVASRVVDHWNGYIPADQIKVYDAHVDLTRPLCPYPKVAVYTGNGSTNDAENFVCRMP